MERRLELEPASREAGGKATRQSMPLQQEHICALDRQLGRRSQATVSSTDHDAVVGLLKALLSRSPSSSVYAIDGETYQSPSSA